MKRAFPRILIAVFCFLFAALLFLDASAQVLAKPNPSTGRVRGCYTMLELVLGMKAPTKWIRLGEFGLSATAGVCAVLILIYRPRAE